MTPTLTFTPPQADFYTWQRYRCAYEFYPGEASQTPLLLIHPIGVGLSREFWHRFCEQWQGQGARNPIYSPDLLGCGESTMPQVAYYPEDWAAQLLVLIQTVIQQPVILVVQGALLPVAIRLMQQLPAQQSDWVKGIILSGPPAWRVMTEAAPLNRQRALWNLFFAAPVGQLFWQYARRRKFVESFSIRQLFADSAAVDAQWLNMLERGAVRSESRYAVFSFLAGFWRQNYGADMAGIAQPTLVIFGDRASSISRSGLTEAPPDRCRAYSQGWGNATCEILPGRNVLPYESPVEFVQAVSQWCARL
ncbi:MAG: alpha/beta hydrolase [Oscillatoriales cyanobacterium RM2_1_1]|nr:alpha/beta hydrolase [Oscillatoriales cyanobacterium RM2_1_1]